MSPSNWKFGDVLKPLTAANAGLRLAFISGFHGSRVEIRGILLAPYRDKLVPGDIWIGWAANWQKDGDE